MKEDIFSTSKAFVSVSDADYINMRPITEHIIALERVVYQSFYIVDFFKKMVISQIFRTFIGEL